MINDDLVCYKTTEISTENKLNFFCEKHSTKEGTWGLLTLQSGTVDFVFLDGGGGELSRHHLSTEKNTTIQVPPSAWHKLSNASQDFKATLSFYCKKWRYFNKRYKLANVHRDLLSTYNNYKLYERNLNILDIGCGSGRNLLYLAKDSHSVTGIDIKNDAIDNIIDISRKEGMKNVAAEVHDLNESLTLKAKSFDLIISTVSLQFLEAQRVPSLLSELQSATACDGVHFLVFPINDASFTLPQSFLYLPESNEIYSFYQDSGWSVLSYKEDVGQLHRRDESGKPIQGVFATLLAQKIG